MGRFFYIQVKGSFEGMCVILIKGNFGRNYYEHHSIPAFSLTAWPGTIKKIFLPK